MMQKGQLDRAKRRALRILDDWIEVTGVVEADSSYRYEMEAIVEDAVECGVQAALGISQPLEGEGLERETKLEALLHAKGQHPDYEYATTRGGRKVWSDSDVPPQGEGWERNIHMGRDGWERFDYHEESYWMRRTRGKT